MALLCLSLLNSITATTASTLQCEGNQAIRTPNFKHTFFFSRLSLSARAFDAFAAGERILLQFPQVTIIN